MINIDAIDVHAHCGRTILPNVDKESSERDELLSIEFVCWTLDLPVRLLTDLQRTTGDAIGIIAEGAVTMLSLQ